MATIAPTEFGHFPKDDAAPAAPPVPQRTDHPHWLRYVAMGIAGVAGAVLIVNPVTRRFAVKVAKAYGAGRLAEIARDALKRG
jgi:hypothetical protein